MLTRRALDSDTIAVAVHRWHRSDNDLDLHTWLGLTWAQYAAWVERGELPAGYELPARAREGA